MPSMKTLITVPPASVEVPVMVLFPADAVLTVGLAEVVLATVTTFPVRPGGDRF